ncbi:hypothetical protein CDEST_06193 [Colletotrichum destructivum]|uniref:Uncharacterized protein n=1 Tax=Colletotrichum destructivum TaxID=34406 RepID=A0AAX4ID32_9PEZI|nr:hypothetical protein CDEST_06193 [Colletotrichum destructivum]
MRALLMQESPGKIPKTASSHLICHETRKQPTKISYSLVLRYLVRHSLPSAAAATTTLRTPPARVDALCCCAYLPPRSGRERRIKRKRKSRADVLSTASSGELANTFYSYSVGQQHSFPSCITHSIFRPVHGPHRIPGPRRISQPRAFGPDPGAET